MVATWKMGAGFFEGGPVLLSKPLKYLLIFRAFPPGGSGNFARGAAVPGTEVRRNMAV